MDNSYANESIKCTVYQCKNHCSSKDNCSLNCIQVGTHECTQQLTSVQTVCHLKRNKH